MNEQQMRQVLFQAVEAEPQIMKSFIQGSDEDTDSRSDISWCSCGKCQRFNDPHTNICCSQSPCITLKPEFRNLCLRHDVLEVANILNWSFRTNLEPSFTPSSFRNHAYRNYVLWQCGGFEEGKRLPVPACATVAIRKRFPEPFGQYEDSCSANSDSE